MTKISMIKWIQEGTLSIPAVLLTKYALLGINENELVMILQLHSFQQKGNSFPTPNQLANVMTFSEEKCMEIIRELLKKGFIEIIEQFDYIEIGAEAYSLEPLWNKLLDSLESKENQHNIKVEIKNTSDEEPSVFSIFEKEFGRLLSPFECETLTMWLDQDQHEESLIKAALKEAVMGGKLNFRYIDRILFEWKKNGINTLEKATDYSKHFRKKDRQMTQNETNYTGTIPFYNWLEK